MGIVNVGIVGVGRVGSAIAFSLIFHSKMDCGNILLNDIDSKRLLGECEDLRQAVDILEKDIIVKTASLNEMRYCQHIIIAAGFHRKDSRMTMDTLYRKNREVVAGIVKKFSKKKVLLITNPASRLGKEFGVRTLETELEDARRDYGGMSGEWILDRKGYTNWGIASVVWKWLE